MLATFIACPPFLISSLFKSKFISLNLTLFSPRFTAHQGEKVAAFPLSLITRTLVLIVVGEPMLFLDFLALNLIFAERIMVAGTIKIDNVIDVLKDRLRKS